MEELLAACSTNKQFWAICENDEIFIERDFSVKYQGPNPRKKYFDLEMSMRIKEWKKQLEDYPEIAFQSLPNLVNYKLDFDFEEFHPTKTIADKEKIYFRRILALLRSLEEDDVLKLLHAHNKLYREYYKTVSNAISEEWGFIPRNFRYLIPDTEAVEEWVYLSLLSKGWVLSQMDQEMKMNYIYRALNHNYDLYISKITTFWGMFHYFPIKDVEKDDSFFDSTITFLGNYPNDLFIRNIPI